MFLGGVRDGGAPHISTVCLGASLLYTSGFTSSIFGVSIPFAVPVTGELPAELLDDAPPSNECLLPARTPTFMSVVAGCIVDALATGLAAYGELLTLPGCLVST